MLSGASAAGPSASSTFELEENPNRRNAGLARRRWQKGDDEDEDEDGDQDNSEDNEDEPPVRDQSNLPKERKTGGQPLFNLMNAESPLRGCFRMSPMVSIIFSVQSDVASDPIIAFIFSLT